MDVQVWWAYFAAMCVIAISPGSGAVLSMSHGLSYGVLRTSPTIVGLQMGLAVVLLVAGLGVGAVLVASATAFAVVKGLGAAYLIWLGWRQWRAPVHVVDGSEASLRVADLTVRQRMLRGFLTDVTNPKGIVFMVAVLPQFIDPARPLAMQLLILLATTVAIDTVVMFSYAWLASRLQRFMRSVRAQRNQNRLFGSVLMVMGASLAFVKRAT